MKIDFHPACLLFPALAEEDLKILVDDIKINGLINPIVTLKGKILDGRNRLEACKLADVEPRFVEWSGKGSPVSWVVSTNLVRRHLTASQRAAVAFDLLPILELEAKERQRLSQGRGKKVAKDLATTSTGKASQVAAEMAKTNSTYVEKVKAISKKAPEIIPAIKSGRLTIGEAGRLANLEKSKRAKILKTAETDASPVKRIMRRVLRQTAPVAPTQARGSSNSIQIFCGDCVEVMKSKISDGTIDVVTTSPPYNQGIKYGAYHDCLPEAEYLKWMGVVFEQIKRVVKDDGSLFLVLGHIPSRPWTPMKVAEIAGRHFVLQNQIIWVKSVTVEGESKGHFTPIKGKRFLNRTWEHVFHFTKSGKSTIDRLAIGVPYQYEVNVGRTGSRTRCGGDVWFIPHETVAGNEDRSNHPATYPTELAERCIKLAGVKKDMLVLDPFCGVNGMVAVANLGIKGIGIDIDPGYCSEAKKKLGLRRSIAGPSPVED